ncbi:GTP-binding protein [Rhodococcus opacus]|uniref:GTP-binding protein n=1 Tax=Rhodococcus opacus TaxID=37919 RepID=UPI0018E130D3|nr:GTP-binding protein [Rhodococcus opacus]
MDRRVFEQSARRRTLAVLGGPGVGRRTLVDRLAGRRVAAGPAAVARFEHAGPDGLSARVTLLDARGSGAGAVGLAGELSATDAALLVIDATTGVSVHDREWSRMCRAHRIPVLTFVNKWDHAECDPLGLYEQIRDLGLEPMPVTWPVTEQGRVRGLMEVRSAAVRGVGAPASAAAVADARESVELIGQSGGALDPAAVFLGTATPLLFGSARHRFGLRELRDTLTSLTPHPAPRRDRSGRLRPLDAPFCVFVAATGVSTAPDGPRPVALARVCSGRMRPDATVILARTDQPMPMPAASTDGRTSSEPAVPGDLLVLDNRDLVLALGDTLCEGDPVVEIVCPADELAVRSDR